MKVETRTIKQVEQIPTPADVTIPHKANPADLGKVFVFPRIDERIRKMSFEHWLWDNWDKLIGVHLEYIAYELMNTDLPMVEGKYDSSPSVLIVGQPSDSVSESFDTLRTSRKSDDFKMFSPFGAFRAPSLGSKFSEYSALADIKVDPKTGLHYLTQLRGGTENTWWTINTMRRFFDIVLVGHPWADKIPRSLVNRVYGDKRTLELEGPSERNREVQYVLSPTDISTAPSEPGLFISLNYTEKAARVVAQDFVRDMVALEGQSLNAVSVLPKRGSWNKLSRWYRNKVKADRYSVPVPMKTSLGSLVAGTVTSFTYFFGAEINGDFSTIDAIVTAIPGSVTGAGVVASLLSLLLEVDSLTLEKRRMKKDIHKLEAAAEDPSIVSPPLKTLSSVRVKNLVLAASHDRKKRIGIKPVIEKVDTRLPLGVNSIEEFASADAEDAIADAEEILFENGSDSYSPRELLQERIDSLQERWMEYELDPIKALDFPLMLDPSCDQTYAFISAMEEVKRVQRRLDLKEVKLPKLTKVVEVAERAFAVAEAHARKMRLAHLDTSGKKKVRTARKMAGIVMDKNASPNERRMAFKQANQILEGVLQPLNPQVIGLLEK